MSWETLVVGHFRFKKVSEEIKRQVIEEVEEVVECRVRYDKKWKEYVFQDVNWSSHVSGENVKEVAEKYKKYLEYFCVSVYYLNEPHENIVLEDGELKARLI